VQSGVCAACDPKDSFANWNETFKSLLYAAAIILGFLAIAVLFFQPLSPRLERMVDATIEFGTNASARAKDCLKCACCRKKPEADAAPKAKAEDEVKAETKQQPQTAALAPNPQAMAASTTVRIGADGAASGDAHAAQHHGAAAFRAKHYSDAAKEAHHDAIDFQLAGNMAYAAGVASAFNVPGGNDNNNDDNDDGSDGGSVGGLSGDGGVDIMVNLSDDIQRALAKVQKMMKIFINFYQVCAGVALPTQPLLCASMMSLTPRGRLRS
jgi:hypothetical protein